MLLIAVYCFISSKINDDDDDDDDDDDFSILDMPRKLSRQYEFVITSVCMNETSVAFDLDHVFE